MRDFTPDNNAESEPQSREEMLDADGSDGNIGVTAYLRLRDRKGVYSNHFAAGATTRAAYSAASTVTAAASWREPSGNSLLIENQGFVVVGGCGASDEDNENPVSIRPGADDKTFRLDKQPLDQCTALRDAQKPAWAKLGPPLRERFAKDGALCLTRDYDAAHLASHPQQTVKRIAVFKSRGRQAARAAAVQSHLPRRAQERPEVRRPHQLLARRIHLRLHP